MFLQWRMTVHLEIAMENYANNRSKSFKHTGRSVEVRKLSGTEN
jgi:hypothetical protein